MWCSGIALSNQSRAVWFNSVWFNSNQSLSVWSFQVGYLQVLQLPPKSKNMHNNGTSWQLSSSHTLTRKCHHSWTLLCAFDAILACWNPAEWLLAGQLILPTDCSTCQNEMVALQCFLMHAPAKRVFQTAECTPVRHNLHWQQFKLQKRLPAYTACHPLNRICIDWSA